MTMTINLIKLNELLGGALSADIAGLVALQTRCYKHIQDFKAREKKPGSERIIFGALLTKTDEYAVDTDLELTQLSYEILTAGTEESGNAMMFTTWYVVNTPGLEEKVVEELDRTFPDPKNMPYSEVDRLPVLNGVWKEALRLSHGIPGRLPRSVPPEGRQIGDTFVPGGVSSNVS